ncbi:DUF6660 family protein [Maribacter dokdonensis]|uniref:DUF6660 family protein n=1 Tax=Maribacter dokdonensis TaxID=320912 RepID=UPI00338D7757
MKFCNTVAYISCYLCTVKYIAIILSVYFLALNFIPCNDVEMSSDDTDIEYVIGMGVNHDHNASDLCSPFCNCHCCHIHTIESNIISFKTLISINFKENFAHFDSFGKDISHSLLQPPRA